MRLRLAVVVVALFPAVAAAQIRSAPAAPAPPPAPPSIGLPLPPIGLPLPPLGLQPPVTTPPVDPGRFPPPRFVYVYPWYYDWNYPYPGMPTDVPRQRAQEKEEPRSGRLRFDVKPEKQLQVFINGYFVGTPEDFDSELELPLGTHTVELTAVGYESVKFEVKIDGTRPITYRGELKPLDPKAAAEPAPVPAAPPSTLYYIPGCYLGNVDPKEVELPANCDLSKLVTKPAGTQH